MLRRLVSPRWLLGLLLALLAAAVMVRLGMWQFGRGEQRHSLQNYSYAIEWVLFAAFTLFFYGRLLRDADREPAADAVPSGVVLAPPPPETEPMDDELAAYNAYLGRLNSQPHR